MNGDPGTASEETWVLTLNAGSSSLKFALFTATASPARVLSGAVSRIGLAGATLTVDSAGPPKEIPTPEVRDHAQALTAVLAELEASYPLSRVTAVGHRIVHGGEKNDRARLVTADLIGELRELSVLDPDHLPAEIAIVEAMRAKAGAMPQVACFDTAFHRTMPPVARLVAIPRRYERAGVRRYGFHGLSYTFLMEELGRIAGEGAARGRIVLAHLGSGASLAAVHEGRCVDTTMGFTPTSGIPMGTRSGDLDPGVLLYLLRTERLSVDALDDLLNRHSGLAGVSETSSDMRDLLAREATDARAADAVALFCYEAKKAIGALAAALGGLDTLVFSGGIGEKAAPIRARIAGGLEHLGVRVDEAQNDAGTPIISTAHSGCTVRVMRTDEEAVVLRQTLAALEPRTTKGRPR